MLQASLEGVVAGTASGAAYGVATLLVVFASVGGSNQSVRLADLPVELSWLALAGLIGAIVGAVAGLVCGVVAGLALSLSGPHPSSSALRLVAAVGAAVPLVVLGGLAFAGDPTGSTLIGVALLALVPAAVAAVVAAIRAPRIVRRPHAYGLGSPEQRRDAVQQLPAD